MQIIERQQDLFQTQISCKAQCISADCGMGKGIVIEFNNRYNTKQLMLQKKREQGDFKIGDCIPIYTNNEIIYHLITKECYYHKPTLHTMKQSLQSLKTQMLKANIDMIAIPKIGSGLDRLHWNDVKKLIQDVFADTSICFNVYYL